MERWSLREFEAEARARLDPAHYDYFAGGAGDEVTVRANEAAFARIGLLPRVLRGAAKLRTGLTLLGGRASMPVLVAPTAFHRLADPEGERATARAAAAAETIMIVSMAATVAIEEVAAAAPGAELWFQLYVQPDLAFTETVVRRAEAAGCKALSSPWTRPCSAGASGTCATTSTTCPNTCAARTCATATGCARSSCLPSCRGSTSTGSGR